MNQNPPLVITISRQLGSGGSYIGQQLAKKLDMYYADHDIISKAAEQLSFTENDLAFKDEKVESFWESFLRYNVLSQDLNVPAFTRFAPTSRQLFEAESKIIHRITEEGAAIIIGRCGFHVLAGYLNKVSIFLYSDMEFRTKRIQETENLSEKEARKAILLSDKERKMYIKNFAEREWTDAQNFDLCIDTGKIGFDNSVQLIIDYLNLRQKNKENQ